MPMISSGCAAAVQKCLKTPVSAKVSDEVVDTCEEAVRANMGRMDVFDRYVGLLRVRNRYSDVVKWSKKILKHDEDRTDALYNLAYGLRKTGHCELALERYREYANRNKEDPDPYYGMGLCHEDLGNRQDAIAAYKTYIEKEKRKSQKVWVERAKLRMTSLGSGAPIAAAPTPTPTPTTPTPKIARPTPAPGLVQPAPVARPLPTPTPSPAPSAAPTPAPAAPVAAAATDCSAHERAFKANPFNTGAYDKWAECSLKSGKHDEVIRYMRIAIRDNPEFGRGWLHLGSAYRAKGNQPQAKSAFAKACSAGVAEACGM
jgi:tetratricopeptide (TPR) repeat protein